jgi:hypothetical protein
MSETVTPKTKKPRGPKKSAADKLTELIQAKRKEVQRLGKKADALAAEQQLAQDAFEEARVEVKQLEAALGALK